jgi:hypothetical protein
MRATPLFILNARVLMWLDGWLMWRDARTSNPNSKKFTFKISFNHPNLLEYPNYLQIQIQILFDTKINTK